MHKLHSGEFPLGDLSGKSGGKFHNRSSIRFSREESTYLYQYEYSANYRILRRIYNLLISVARYVDSSAKQELDYFHPIYRPHLYRWPATRMGRERDDNEELGMRN